MHESGAKPSLTNLTPLAEHSADIRQSVCVQASAILPRHVVLRSSRRLCRSCSQTHAVRGLVLCLAYQSQGNYSKAIEYLGQHLVIAKEVGKLIVGKMMNHWEK